MRVESIVDQAGQKASVTALTDLRSGDVMSRHVFGPFHSAHGFDGTRVWQQSYDGIVTLESGIAIPLAVDAAYVSGNRWWQPHFGNATVTLQGHRRCGRSTCTVLVASPQGGLPFQAWFDDRSHLLVRTVTQVGGQTFTNALSDYRRVDGVMVPYRRVASLSFSKRAIVDTQSGGQRAKGVPAAPKHVVNLGAVKETLATSTAEFIAFVARPPPAAFSAPKSRVHNVAFTNGADRTTFPFKLIGDNVFADVRVNGRGPFRFIFDTGGKNLVLPLTAKTLGIHVWPFVLGGQPAARKDAPGLAKIDTLDVGGAHFQDLPVGVADIFPTGGSGLPAQGMIGAGVFDAFVDRFDYATHEITLINPDKFDPSHAGVAIPFELIGSIPVIKGEFEGISGGFAVDTGAAAALLLTPRFVAEHHLHATNPHGVTTIVGEGVAGRILAYATRAKGFRIGPFRLSNIATVMSETTYGPEATPLLQGIVGNGVLRHFVVTLDYATRTAYFKPIAPLPVEVGRFDRSGLACLAPVKTGFKIWCVTPHSPAEQAGAELGQIITRVNGVAATSIPLRDFIKRMRTERPGTVVHLTATQGTITHHFTMILRNQI